MPDPVPWFAVAVLALILARAGAQFWLERLNEQHVRTHAANLPSAYAGVMDAAAYTKSTEYTLAKGQLAMREIAWDTIVLIALLFSGVLPDAFENYRAWAGNSAGSNAAFLILVGMFLSILSLPLSWHAQFGLEESFGFNTTTPKTWLLDRVKGLALVWALGWPLLALLLKWVQWAEQTWWIWAWISLMFVQALLVALAPTLILPLFNKFTPLPEGDLRDELLALGATTGFTAKAIMVMDGSKRSRHSNALFTGFGRFRKVVLFDTLIERLKIEELKAVLAHEIGHYKMGHIPKFMLVSAVTSLASFFILAWLARQPWFYSHLGFNEPHIAMAFLIFGLVSGAASFWISPAMNIWSRKYEFEADAYAQKAVGAPEPLLEALRKLTRDNLSNLTPHPLYSWFYHSHPTLLEREAAMMRSSKGDLLPA